MATVGIEAGGSTDVEKHIHNLEFENQQFVKAIEKERTVVDALEAQITEYEAEITRLQQATSQLDEDTKLYHKQFLQNRDNIESLKTSVSLSQHVDVLKDQYQHVIRKGQLEKEEHETTLEHYNKIWADYETQYLKFPQAQVLNQAKQELQKVQENLSVAIGRKHHIQETLRNSLSENGQNFEPYSTVNELVVKLAEIKVSSMRKEEEIKTRDKECKEIKREIEKRLQDALRIKQEAERKQQEEEAQRRRELELHRQREEEAQRKAEEEARRLHEEALRKQEDAQRKQREEELKRARATAEQNQKAQYLANSRTPSFTAPRLQMPPIIAQRGIKLPALQVPRRPSASMPQLNIPTMSPRPGVSSRPAYTAPLTAPSPSPKHVPAPTVTMSATRAPPTPTLSMPINSNYSAPSPVILPPAPSRPPGSQSSPGGAVAPTLVPPPSLHPSVPLVTRPPGTSSNERMEEAATPARPTSSAACTASPVHVCDGDSPLVPLAETAPQGPAEAQIPTTNTSCSPPPVKTPKRAEQDVTAKDKTPGRTRDEEAYRTPGRTPGGSSSSSAATTPKTPGSGFSISKELARMKLLGADSPSTGFLYSKREPYEENRPQSQWEESPSARDKEEARLSFFQPFQGPAASKGGGDELPPRGGNKVSPKNTATTEPAKDVTTTPSRPQGAGDAGIGFMQGFNFNSPETSESAGAGMGMFGSPKVLEDSGFNFFKTPSAAPDNHMNLFGDPPQGAAGGFQSAAPSTNVFSMFGGDGTDTDDGDSGQGGFSFNFGGTAANNSTTSGSSSAAFSLF